MAVDLPRALAWEARDTWTCWQTAVQRWTLVRRIDTNGVFEFRLYGLWECMCVIKWFFSLVVNPYISVKLNLVSSVEGKGLIDHFPKDISICKSW